MDILVKNNHNHNVIIISVNTICYNHTLFTHTI